MLKKRTLLIVFAIISLQTTSFAAKSKLPDWVTEGTIGYSEYYNGVGYVKKLKKKDIPNYTLARRDALNALSQEITVNVKAHSVAVSVKLDQKTQTDLTSVIRARVTQDLPACELVATYEDKTGYWVYYRLLKSDYEAYQAEKRKNALGVAESNYKIAKSSKENKNYKKAIVHYIKAIDAIKAFSDQPNFILVDNEFVDLISDSYLNLQELFSDVKIDVLASPKVVRYGKSTSSNSFSFVVKDSNGNGISNFPLLVEYTERILPQESFVSDANGRLSFGLPIVQSHKPTEQVMVTLNKIGFFQEASVDFVVRNWLMQLPVTMSIVDVEVQKPTVYLNSNNKIVAQYFISSFKSALEKNNYKIVNEAKNADITIDVEATSLFASTPNGLFSASTDFMISMKETINAKVVGHKDKIVKTHSTHETAVIECCNEAVKRLPNYILEFEKFIKQ